MRKTWRPQTPAEELARCRIFCFSLFAGGLNLQPDISTWGLATSTSRVTAEINLPQALRINPTVSVNVVSGIFVTDGTLRACTAVGTTAVQRPDQIGLSFDVSGTPLTQFRTHIVRFFGSGITRLILEAGV